MDAPIFKAEAITNIIVQESTGLGTPTEARCLVTFTDAAGVPVAHIDMTFGASRDFTRLVEQLTEWRATAGANLILERAH